MATVASATSTFAFDRLAGSDRYATAVAVATQYGNSANVILANGDSRAFPDALTASYLAGKKKAPVMLTKKDTTPANVLARIAAGGATDVWLVGGEGVISAAQATALDVLYTVHRLGGLDRYLTAQAVIADAGTATSTTAVLATGVNFPDAIAGGPLSYVKGMPLAITATNSLPAATLAALKTAGTTKVIVLGGPTVVTQAVLDTLAANGITLDQRIFGANRSETSSKLAEYLLASQGFSNTGVNVASGYAFGGGADALGGGPLSGKENRPTLITESVTNVGPGPIAYLTAHAPTLTTGHIFGGLGAVSAASEAAMQAAARATTSNQTFAVTPTTSSVLALVASETTNNVADDRQYSVAGLDATKAYTVALFPAGNVSTSTSNQVTFADAAGTANQADGIGSTAVAHITVLNNAPASGGIVTTVAGGTSLSFTIDGDAAGSVVPVVFQDANTNGQLDLVVPTTANANPKAPSEAFGIGGQTTYTTPEAPLGTATVVTTVVDTTNNFLSDASFTYNWDANDTFQFAGVGVSQAAFESALNKGDTATVNYNPDAAGVSVFNLSTDTVKVPGTPTTTVSNLNSGASANDVRATFTPNADAASGDTYSLTDAGVVVTGTTQAAGTTAGTITITKLDAADGVHTYGIRAFSALGSVSTDSAGTASTVVPLAADVTRPTSTLTSLVTDGGLVGDLGTGDTFGIQFSETMLAPVAGATIRVDDADTTLADVVNGTNATFTLNATVPTTGAFAGAAVGTVLTVTMTANPTVITIGAPAGSQYPNTVTTSAGITDLAGNTWNVAGSTTAAIAASAVIQGITVTWGTTGVVGNSKSIVIVQGTGASVPLSAAISGNVITVTLGTNSSSVAVVSDRTAVAGVIAGVTGVGTAVPATGTGATAVTVNPSVAFTGGAAAVAGTVIG